MPYEKSDPFSCIVITLSCLSDDPSTSSNECWHGGRWSPGQYAHLLVHEWISHRVLLGMYKKDLWLGEIFPYICGSYSTLSCTGFERRPQESFQLDKTATQMKENEIFILSGYSGHYQERLPPFPACLPLFHVMKMLMNCTCKVSVHYFVFHVNRYN